jgi:hypothetical protein
VTSRLYIQYYSNALAKQRLNIQSEITYSTTVFENNTTMALVDRMERCNLVSASTETVATGHSTL